MYICITTTTIRILNSFTPKQLLVLSLCSHTLFSPLTPGYHLYLSIALLTGLSFQESHINGIIEYTTFWDWLPLLSAIPLINPNCCTYQCIIHFYCWEVLCPMDMPQFIYIHPLKSIGSLSGYVTRVAI